ncbi:hypothetical protein HYT52_04520 [Candidatus Woesearchaeota archaeon]|nr:hypothetical protein [Candidatus Woesearchaeota archaeon]
MKIVEISAEKVDQEGTPLLYLGTTPLEGRVGQPTSTLFVTPRMTHGGLYDQNPDTTPVEDLVRTLVGTIDDYQHLFREGVDLRVYVDPSSRPGLWVPVIDALREHYSN